MKITDMSLRDKILQTVVIRLNKEKFDARKVGAVFTFGEIITEADEVGLDGARKILAQYIDNADIPVLITSDFENGCGSMLKGLTPLPYLMSLGATNSEEIAYNYGKATALEARSVGANWTFSPICDLNLNPRNPLVNVRGLTDDPALAVKLLRQVIRGMQENGLAACAKHFPGDGVDYRDQHIVTTNNSLPYGQWLKQHGKVFQELIDDGVYSIMAGHITLPDYQKEVFHNGMKLPATLSGELMTGLLKKEMGFKGVIVTDALDMGGYLGWYPDRRRADVESFKAGADMMLWPGEHYVDDMVQAVENGYVPMERLDDAVTRVLDMKEKLGMFNSDNHAVKLSADDAAFVKKTQAQAAENSITLIRDGNGVFPLDREKVKRIALIPVTHYQPAFDVGEELGAELRARGFEVDYFREGVPEPELRSFGERYDLILYSLFSRPFRPIGFLDFMGEQGFAVAHCCKYNADKTAVVSFGSPYFGEQYFERCPTYVNAYSMLSPSARAFVRAAVGEIPFTDFSPVKL